MGICIQFINSLKDKVGLTLDLVFVLAMQGRNPPTIREKFSVKTSRFLEKIMENRLSSQLLLTFIINMNCEKW